MRDEAITRSFALRLPTLSIRVVPAVGGVTVAIAVVPPERGWPPHPRDVMTRQRRLIARGLSPFGRPGWLSRARLGRWSRQLVAL